MGYGYCNNTGNGGYDRCGGNNNQAIANFRKLVKAFLAAHKDFEENLDEASNFANKALDSLKDSAEAFNCSLKYAEKIAEWIEKYGDEYDYNFDDCEDLGEELEKLLCEINKEIRESLRNLYEAIEDINGVKELDDKFDETVKEYVECIKDNNDNNGCGCTGRR